MLRWQCDRLISLCLLPFLSICFFFLLQLFYFLLFNLSKLCTCLISHLYYTILKAKTDRCNLIYNGKEKIRSWESIIRRLCLSEASIPSCNMTMILAHAWLSGYSCMWSHMQVKLLGWFSHGNVRFSRIEY